MSRPAVFLDRDGVVIEALVRGGRPHPPPTADDMVVLPGVVEACRRFQEAGLAVIVVTNQPDVRRGTTTREAVEAINDALRARVPLDELVVCYHDGPDACGCRKPAPGMLVDTARRRSILLSSSVMVGDRWSDVEAGRRAGCATVWVRNDYHERPPYRPDLSVAGLADAVPWILAHCQGAVRP